MEGNGTRILAQDQLMSNGTRVTGINNNDLIIGPSGAGKTRNYVKPDLLQCNHSLIVADTKGSLLQEVGPVMAAHGFRVVNLDFTDLLNNTWGYNPLDYIRYDPARKKYREQDILTVSNCLLPVENRNDPFWEESAQHYVTALIGYVLEALPREEHNLESVCRLYQVMEAPGFDRLFEALEAQDRGSCACRTYWMASGNRQADRTHASIKMFLARALGQLAFDGPVHLYRLKNRIDFKALGREKTALFLTISDTDRSMDKLVNLLYTQAFQALCESADKDYPDHRLPVPVRFILDDFATNVVIPDFDKLISVIRSREIYVSLIIQSITQLYDLYGEHKGKTIINNCDSCLYLGGQDVDTANFISVKANKPRDKILDMPLGEARLEGLLSGRNLPIAPEVKDEQGQYSEVKAWSVVRRLMSAARYCMDLGILDSKSLSRGDLACLRAFLYCVIRLSSDSSGLVEDMGLTGTYQDLLYAARRMEYAAKDQLHFYELHMPELLSGFFNWMDEAYWQFTGADITERIGEADRLAVRDIYWDAISQMNDMVLEEAEPYDPDFTTNWIDDGPEEQEDQEQWDRAEAFPEKERFCQCYLFLRDQYFEGGLCRELPRIVERVLDVFLAGRVTLPFLEDDTFSQACELLEEVEGKIIPQQ